MPDWRTDEHLKAVVNQGFEGAKSHLKSKYKKETAALELKDVAYMTSESKASKHYILTLTIEIKNTKKINLECSGVVVYEPPPGQCKQTPNKFCLEFKPRAISCSDDGKEKSITEILKNI